MYNIIDMFEILVAGGYPGKELQRGAMMPTKWHIRVTIDLFSKATPLCFFSSSIE
jgi:hypothetical protein